VGRYDLRIKPSAVKEIEALPTVKDRQRVLQRIAGLADNPRPPGCEKLSTKARYRVRQGRFRILYEIHGRKLIVWVVKIGDRKDAYR
jgi:mRNA interferase RelE/StbE